MVLMQYNEIAYCVFSEMRYNNIVIRKNRKNVSSTVRRRIKGGSLSWLRRITSARSVWSLNPCLCRTPATPGEAARLAAISLRPASKINNRKTAVWLYSGLFCQFGRWKHHGFPVRTLDKSPSDLYNNTVVCRVSSSVERSLPKPQRRVRFPYLAPECIEAVGRLCFSDSLIFIFLSLFSLFYGIL